MKKLFLSALVPCLILVSGCQYPWQTNETSPQSALEESKSETGENVVEVSESQIESLVPVGTGSEVLEEYVSEPQIYESKELGIKFTPTYSNNHVVIVEKDNSISSFFIPEHLIQDITDEKTIKIVNNILKEMLTSYVPIGVLKEQYYIEVFTKEKDETVEEAILNIIQKEGKDISKCNVINKGSFLGSEDYDRYVLELVDSDIKYTEEELTEIEIAEQETIKQGGGAFNGKHRKRVIYNRRLIETCSYYADPLGLSTSTTTPSMFIYNQKNKIIFLTGTWDVPFYEGDSLEF